MHDTTIYNIKLDFEKSKASYIFDKHTQRSYLDFFGLYSSVVLGYSHPIFATSEFREELNRAASIKVPNCEVVTDEAQEFLKAFSGHKAMQPFKNFHFCCTGSLAIEASIKIAIDQKKVANPMVLSFKESFHGINSYGGLVTDRFVPVNGRLDGFPEIGWQKLASPKLIYSNSGIDEVATQEGLVQFKEEFNTRLKEYGSDNIVALLVEPIQSTYGDNYYPSEFFTLVRELCDQYKVCLIFDEIQTGFGPTGKMWYFEHTEIIPDIVVFGKKALVSGVMVRETMDETFKEPIRLEVTWDGDLLDMIRCKYVLKVFDQGQVLENVKCRGQQLTQGLKRIDILKNVRSCGVLVAFDFDESADRDVFFNELREQGLICNKTRDKSIRFRPNLNVSEDEVEEALRIVKEVCQMKLAFKPAI